MRTIKYIFISAALLTGFVSCDLNEFPKDSISPDTFFHTESELELYTNQFYLMEPTAVNLYDEPSNLIVDGLSQSDVVVGLTRTVPSSGRGMVMVLSEIYQLLSAKFPSLQRCIRPQTL